MRPRRPERGPCEQDAALRSSSEDVAGLPRQRVCALHLLTQPVAPCLVPRLPPESVLRALGAPSLEPPPSSASIFHLQLHRGEAGGGVHRGSALSAVDGQKSSSCPFKNRTLTAGTAP